MELPYVVKGMDVSFSGILSYIEDAARRMIDKASFCSGRRCGGPAGFDPDGGLAIVWLFEGAGWH